MKSLRRITLTAFILIFASETVLANSKGKVTQLDRTNVSHAYAPKALGLFIGIQEFNDPFWHELKYPKKDVRDMIAFFTDNAAISLDDHLSLTEPFNSHPGKSACFGSGCPVPLCAIPPVWPNKAGDCHANFCGVRIPFLKMLGHFYCFTILINKETFSYEIN